MKTLFDKLKIQLPILLYNRHHYYSKRYLYYYKCFLEHLQALDLDDYKYNLEDLSVYGHELLILLNSIYDQDYSKEELHLFDELKIDWSTEDCNLIHF